MNIALYAMFIGLLVPACKKSKAVLFIALLAMSIHTILSYIPLFAGISIGLKIVITTVIAAMTGALIFPTEEAE